MTPERMKDISSAYSAAKDRADEWIVSALEETYKAVTGRQVSDALRDKFYDAIRFEG